MIRSYKKMIGSRIQALDSEIGNLKDIYFDDLSWNVQYFVVDLGSWLSDNDVLVPPSAVAPFEGSVLNVELTKTELKSSPVAESAIPVSLRQNYRENSLVNLLCTSGGSMYGGPMMVPAVSIESTNQSDYDPHLRCCKSIARYEVIGPDGKIGTVQDILVDDAEWVLRFLSVALDTALEEKTVLCRPQNIEGIEWALSTVKIGTTRDQASKLPRFNPLEYLDTSYDVLESSLLNPGK